MGSSATSVSSAVDLPPDSPRPPFTWTVSLPLNWRLVDLHPSRTDSVVANLLRDDDLVPGVRLSSAERRQMKEALLSMAKQAREAGTLLALVFPGIDNGVVAAVTLLIRWVDSSPNVASVMSAQIQFGGDDTSVERTGKGASYVLRSSESLTGPVTDRRTAYTHQAFLPIASTTWTAVVSATAPSVETSEDTKNVVKRVTSSLIARPDQSASDAPEHQGENRHSSEAEETAEEKHQAPAEVHEGGSRRVLIDSEGVHGDG